MLASCMKCNARFTYKQVLSSAMFYQSITCTHCHHANAVTFGSRFRISIMLVGIVIICPNYVFKGMGFTGLLYTCLLIVSSLFVFPFLMRYRLQEKS